MDTLPQPKAQSLSIVIPYYNEESNIEASISETLAYLRGRFEDFELIAVDDHSSDRTLAIARQLQADEPRIKVIALDRNTRFAGALKAGLAAVQKDYVFYTDGDLPIDCRDIDIAIQILDRYDVVVGFRTSRDREGWIRKLYTTGYRLMLRFLLGLTLRDVNFSFKLFPQAALRTITIESAGSFIDAEILYKLLRAGCRVGEIPVRYHSRSRGTSTLASPRIIFHILRELIQFRQNNPKLNSTPAEGRIAV